MDKEATLQELEEIAGAMHRVLGDEFEALKRLDSVAVERAASCKEVLTGQLAALHHRLPDLPVVRSTIGKIQAASHANQALLVHARACIRGALELSSGGSSEPASYARPNGSGNGSAQALRFDIRG
jgi:hypothetical protein